MERPDLETARWYEIMALRERRTINIRKDIMRRWAEATRHMRWDDANQLWHELMVEWLKPTLINQGYWNDLLARKMAVLERREQRSTITDDEWDNTHQDMNR